MPEHFDRIDGLIMADSIYCGYTGDPKDHKVDPALMDGFRRFALEAAAGRKTFLVTHSALIPEGYASTAETADFLIDAVAGRADPVKVDWATGWTQTRLFEGSLRRPRLRRDRRTRPHEPPAANPSALGALLRGAKSDVMLARRTMTRSDSIAARLSRFPSEGLGDRLLDSIAPEVPGDHLAVGTDQQDLRDPPHAVIFGKITGGDMALRHFSPLAVTSCLGASAFASRLRPIRTNWASDPKASCTSFK